MREELKELKKYSQKIHRGLIKASGFVDAEEVKDEEWTHWSYIEDSNKDFDLRRIYAQIEAYKKECARDDGPIDLRPYREGADVEMQEETEEETVTVRLDSGEIVEIPLRYVEVREPESEDEVPAPAAEVSEAPQEQEWADEDLPMPEVKDPSINQATKAWLTREELLELRNFDTACARSGLRAKQHILKLQNAWREADHEGDHERALPGRQLRPAAEELQRLYRLRALLPLRTTILFVPPCSRYLFEMIRSFTGGAQDLRYRAMEQLAWMANDRTGILQSLTNGSARERLRGLQRDEPADAEATEPSEHSAGKEAQQPSYGNSWRLLAGAGDGHTVCVLVEVAQGADLRALRKTWANNGTSVRFVRPEAFPRRKLRVWRWAASWIPKECEWLLTVKSSSYVNLKKVRPRIGCFSSDPSLKYLGFLKAEGTVRSGVPGVAVAEGRLGIVLRRSLLRGLPKMLERCEEQPEMAGLEEALQPWGALPRSFSSLYYCMLDLELAGSYSKAWKRLAVETEYLYSKLSVLQCLLVLSGLTPEEGPMFSEGGKPGIRWQ
eukprot:g30232.t1